ncbi:MAG: lysostaphin resistance A-like protein [Hyphomicrobium sp.]
MTTTQDRDAAGSLFSGPDRYEPITPWSPLAALLVTLAACVAALIVGMVAMVIANLVTGVALEPDSPELEQVFSLASPSGIAIAAGTQIVSLAIIWLAAGRKGMRKLVLQLARPMPGWSTLLTAALVVVAATTTLELALYFLTRFDIFADSVWLKQGLSSPWWPGTLIVAVVLAPLWEELAFRGFLLSSLAQTRIGFWGAGVVTTALWTLLHLGYSWQGLTSVFLAGLVLTWLLQRTGSIWVPIFAHAFANACALAFAHFAAPVA